MEFGKIEFAFTNGNAFCRAVGINLSVGIFYVLDAAYRIGNTFILWNIYLNLRMYLDRIVLL